MALPSDATISEYDQQKETYRSQLESIISTPLCPETIDSYADDALVSLIGLIDRVETDARSRIVIPEGTTPRDIETATFAYYGLSDIETILDHIYAKSEEIRHLGQVIEDAFPEDTVLVPPDPTDRAIVPGNGNFRAKSTIPRLKTVLFILANEFDVDVDDPEQVALTKGVIANGMMRKTSYYSVEVPQLQRTILVCDEEGNVTYVLDTAALREAGISHDDIINLTKTDIKALLSEYPGLGRRLIYSERFVERMVEALQEQPPYKTANKSQASSDIRSEFLRPKLQPPPEGYLNVTDMSQKYSVALDTLLKVINKLGPDLGSPERYRRHRPADYYSPAQQHLIEVLLEEEGKMNPLIPGGYRTVSRFARSNGMRQHAVEQEFEKVLQDESNPLGEIKRFRVTYHLTYALSPEQQQAFLTILRGRGVEKLPKAPEGTLSILGISNLMGINEEAVTRVARELESQESFGKVDEFLFGNFPTSGYNTQQVEKIIRKLTEDGTYGPIAPEGTMNIKDLGEHFGISSTTAYKVVRYLRHEGKIGARVPYRYGTSRGDGILSDDIGKVEAELKRRGLLMSVGIPSGMLTVAEISRVLQRPRQSIDMALSNLDGSENFGDVVRIRPRQASKLTRVVTLEQQRILKDYFENTVNEKPPEGHKSISKLARELHLGVPKIASAISDLQETGKIGNVGQVRYKGKNRLSVSPETEMLIVRELEEKGMLFSSMPDDVLTASAIEERYKVQWRQVALATRQLEEEGKMGEVKIYRISKIYAKGYDTFQQDMILERIRENRRRAILGSSVK